jgi:hypothetical protein
VDYCNILKTAVRSEHVKAVKGERVEGFFELSALGLDLLKSPLFWAFAITGLDRKIAGAVLAAALHLVATIDAIGSHILTADRSYIR